MATELWWVQIGKDGKPKSSTVRTSRPTDIVGWLAFDPSFMIGDLKPVVDSNWTPTTKWMDGSVMDDSKLFKGWYEKDGDGYKVRKWTHRIIDLGELGFVADGTTDNIQLWNKLVAYTPKTKFLKLDFPDGEYYFSDTVVLEDRRWHLSGDGAVFVVPGNRRGFFYNMTPNSGVSGSIFSGFGIVSQGGAIWDGVPGATYGFAKQWDGKAELFYELDTKKWRARNGSYITSFIHSDGNEYPNPERSKDPEHYSYNGFEFHAKCEVHHVSVGNFSGAAFVNWASINLGLNTSHSYIHECSIHQCGFHGLYTVGPDSNGCLYMNIDIRDCDGKAIEEKSELGNTYFNVMIHYAKMGSVHTSENPGNNSTIISLYNEASPYPGGELGSGTVVIGGVISEGWTGDGQGITNETGARIRGINGIGFKPGTLVFPKYEDDNNKSFSIVTGENNDSADDTAKRFSKAAHINGSYYKPDSLLVYTDDTVDNNRKVGRKTMGVDGIRVQSIALGDQGTLYSMSPDMVVEKQITIVVGDEFKYNGRKWEAINRNGKLEVVETTIK